MLKVSTKFDLFNDWFTLQQIYQFYNHLLLIFSENDCFYPTADLSIFQTAVIACKFVLHERHWCTYILLHVYFFLSSTFKLKPLDQYEVHVFHMWDRQKKH